ncbi:helix-turn-helix transcriptional regulator [Candidatus Pacearchaeota archaeon]|nr:helix-turn-helix transcriptional regulator [Candidatus Pacearchaeota archaeon]
MQNITDIPSELKRLRAESGATLKEVAEFAHLSPAAISQYENGRSEPSFATIERLASFYGLTCTIRFEVSAQRC